MGIKIVLGLIGVALVLAYVVPVVWKLKEVALTIVVLIGVVMILVDTWQSTRSRED